MGLVTWCISCRSDDRVSTDIITGARWYKRMEQRVTKHNPPVGKILSLSSRPTTLNFGVSLDGHIPGLRGTEVGTALQKVGVDSYDHMYRDCQNEGIRLRQPDDRSSATPDRGESCKLAARTFQRASRLSSLALDLAGQQERKRLRAEVYYAELGGPIDCVEEAYLSRQTRKLTGFD